MPSEATQNIRVNQSPDAPARHIAARCGLEPSSRSNITAGASAGTPGPAADPRYGTDPPDIEERARAALARKLAALPGLASHDPSLLTRQTWDILAALVNDEGERVRAIVAELVQHMAHAPKDLILRLARDTAFSVSDPVLRLSPLLTEEDLLGLLAEPGDRTAESIARRPDLGERVCDQIARTASTLAVRCLLQNPSAAIRESTLDTLVAQASEHADWHQPLVLRPGLSARNTRLLGGFVSDQLLRVLAARPELDPALVRELQDGLRRRMAEYPRGPRGSPVQRSRQWLAEARALQAAGGLNDAAILAVIRTGDAARVATLLAVAAAVPVDAVQRVAKLRAVKAIVSLIWKAGLSMETAIPLQALLCNVPPAAMLPPAQNGGFPLAEEEMRWQVDFLSRSTGGPS